MRSWNVGALVAVGALSLAHVTANAQQAVAKDRNVARSAANTTFNRPVTIRLQRVPVRAAVDALAREAGVQVQYRDAIFEPIQKTVTLDISDVPFGVALGMVLQGTPLAPESPVSGFVTIQQQEQQQMAEDGIVMGTITHAKTKQPLVGVTVSIGDKSTVTAEDGTYRLTVSSGEHLVQTRSVGLLQQSKTVSVESGATLTLDFVLEPSTNVLSEVVVTGTVVATERKAIPTPITVIKGEELERRGITRIEQLLRGEVPGVMVLEKGSYTYRMEPGAMQTNQVFSRGGSTLNADNGGSTPLKTFVDGVEISDPSFLGTIDPQNIERIEIVTGPQAATIYGSGAIGGVMQIFTKKGVAGSAPEFKLTLQYGLMESNLSSAKTPAHSHLLSMTGSNGPGLSYAGNLTYRYDGQWQPNLFNRAIGGSVGATSKQGDVSVNASFNTLRGKNGVAAYGLQSRVNQETGVYTPRASYLVFWPMINASTSYTGALSVDYQLLPSWSHHVTFGTSQTDFELVPQAPALASPSDTMFMYRNMNHSRTTVGYNTTLTPAPWGVMSALVTVGFTSSQGKQNAVWGRAPSAHSTTLPVTVTAPQRASDKSQGGFLQARLGVWEQLFLSFGLRAEKNPSYGRNHTIDWTPTQGATYTVERGELTVKFLASYGRATRAPAPDYRLQVMSINPNMNPSLYESRREAPDLTPEYSHGPQGGVEIYYGNRGSLTINRYRQDVSDLIQSVVVDSAPWTWVGPNCQGCYGDYYRISQYQNAASVRQQGWEGVATLNVVALSLKGTYSWNDSRIISVSPKYTGTTYWPGKTFRDIPSHSANVVASYAHGGTSVTAVLNWVGSSVRIADINYEVNSFNTRLMQYISRTRLSDSYMTRVGYVKTDISILQRVNPWISGTVQITNLGNSFGSESDYLNPALGRKTLIGIRMRYAGSR